MWSYCPVYQVKSWVVNSFKVSCYTHFYILAVIKESSVAALPPLKKKTECILNKYSICYFNWKKGCFIVDSRCLEGDSKKKKKGAAKWSRTGNCFVASLSEEFYNSVLLQNETFFMLHINQLFHQWLDSPKALRLVRNVIFCSLCHILCSRHHCCMSLFCFLSGPSVPLSQQSPCTHRRTDSFSLNLRTTSG